MKAAIWSDEKATQEAVDKAVLERQEFGRWWRENAPESLVYNTLIREWSFNAWKAGRRVK